MQVIPIIIASVLIIFGVFIRPTKNEQSPKTVVETIAPTPREPFEEPQDMDSGQAPTPTPKPTSTPSLNFQYPISRIITQSETSLILESDGDSDAITNWYKEKIKTMGMNTKSFVTTKTNGTIKNVLVGANGKEELRAEISKSNNESTVRIVVTYRTY